MSNKIERDKSQKQIVSKRTEALLKYRSTSSTSDFSKYNSSSSSDLRKLLKKQLSQVNSVSERQLKQNFSNTPIFNYSKKNEEFEKLKPITFSSGQQNKNSYFDDLKNVKLSQDFIKIQHGWIEPESCYSRDDSTPATSIGSIYQDDEDTLTVGTPDQKENSLNDHSHYSDQFSCEMSHGSSSIPDEMMNACMDESKNSDHRSSTVFIHIPETSPTNIDINSTMSNSKNSNPESKASSNKRKKKKCKKADKDKKYATDNGAFSSWKQDWFAD